MEFSWAPPSIINICIYIYTHIHTYISSISLDGISFAVRLSSMLGGLVVSYGCDVPDRRVYWYSICTHNSFSLVTIGLGISAILCLCDSAMSILPLPALMSV